MNYIKHIAAPMLLVLFLIKASFLAFGDEPIDPGVPHEANNSGKREHTLKLIVLDPGHGGFDPGAIGPGGVKEKDVVLQVAKFLEAAIEENTDIEVVLTRETDVFIPLRERAEISNRLGADLFISIHANAARRRAVGFETFFLSARASDDDSRALALMENAIVEAPGVSAPGHGSDVNSEVEAILFDMAQSEYIKESETLAMFVQDRMANAVNSPNRGVKQAPFAVLMGAASPAVLVEIGFMTNKQELAALTDPAMQEKIATALTLSIKDFAKRRELRIGGGDPKKTETGTPE